MENNKTLVYDDACPLCAWYTGAFVQTGLLNREGRKAFSGASPELLHAIDWQRSKNEIPLYDPQTRKVLYGIDALLDILGNRFTCIKTIGYTRPVNWFLKKLYNIISYNRKVIVARKTAPGTIDCTPAFNSFYRIVFMTGFLLFNTLMLIPVHNLVLSHLPGYHHSFMSLQAAHFALVLVNCLLASRLRRRKAIDYLGQVNMLALITILLLLPLMVVNTIWPNAGLFSYGYLLLLTFFIIKDYFRRMDYAGILYRHRVILKANFLCLTGFITWLIAF